MVALTNSSGNLSLYIDSVLISQATIAGSFSGTDYYIGQNLVFTGRDYIGEMDEMGIWRRALTMPEIMYLYNGRAGLGFPFDKPQSRLLYGPLAYWKLDNNGSGGVSLVDSTGNGNTLTNEVYVPLTDGIIGGGAYFNGNYLGPISLPANSYLQWTVSLWMRWNGAYGSDYQQQIFFSSATDLGVQIYLHEDTGHLAVAMYGPVQGYDTGYTISADSKWHHYVVTQDSLGNVNVYVDGMGVYFVNVSVGFLGGYPTVLGAEATDYIQSFHGSLDEIGIWTRPLAIDEIRVLYNLGFGFSYPFALPDIRNKKLAGPVGIGDSALLTFD
jgi:hypothetical protein